MLDKIINYINNNFNIDSATSLNDLEKLFAFINENQINLTEKEIVYIISNNDKLYMTIAKIVKAKKHQELIKTSPFFKMLFTGFLTVKNSNIDYSNTSLSNLPEMNNFKNIRTLLLESEDKILSYEETALLCKQIKEGNQEARDKIIRSNLKLVLSIAIKYQNQGSELEDLFQEGCTGLIIAAEKYDYTLGWNFSTFAYYLIRKNIKDYIHKNSRAIRLPNNIVDNIIRIKYFIRNYYERNYKNPTNAEIAKELNLTENQVDNLLFLSNQIISLSEFVTEASKSDLDTFLPNKSIISTEEKIFYAEIKHAIFEGDLLTEKEKRVLAYRFGFVNNKLYTLDAVGKILGFSGEGIRIIESRAIDKLRYNYFFNEPKKVVKKK